MLFGISNSSQSGFGSSSFLFLAETEQQEACKKFEDISALAKTELKDLKKRRVLAFKKNLADLADLEIKHAKVSFLFFRARLCWKKNVCSRTAPMNENASCT
ncbi:unnamed protein product [Cylicostephanus goldi]|uniref:Sorting nexin/Vps5-like C-terminal domain-containing protein n=1 Tax=Cylicostephanus goldi TaxID=71465 RepID=A0A3P6QX52_CYLGO|nr:unnamed protein product [Cylicostephanus goldi]